MIDASSLCLFPAPTAVPQGLTGGNRARLVTGPTDLAELTIAPRSTDGTGNGTRLPVVGNGRAAHAESAGDSTTTAGDSSDAVGRECVVDDGDGDEAATPGMTPYSRTLSGLTATGLDTPTAVSHRSGRAITHD